jgi:hypothetical protein
MIDDWDGWCLDCGDPFHLDDCGGYNPPCSCGCGMCRSCCEQSSRENDDDFFPEDDPVAHPVLGEE